MRQTVIAGLSIALLLMGCTSLKPAPPESAARPAAPAPEVQHPTETDSVAKPPEPPSAAAAAEGQTARTSSANVNPAAPTAIAPETPSVEAPVTSSMVTSPKTSAHTTPLNPSVSAKQPDAGKRAALPAPRPTVDSASMKPPPSLDFSSLQQRLRDTHAIGVFTKLSLKNQVDDLLAAFRAYYGGTLKVPLSELRQRYDLLLLKVLTLLQDGDPPLAATISNSKEAIWGILADPQKFATL
jgi:hypothetical protein